MNIIYKFSILSSFLGLWITSLLPEAFELILGFILIFTFGMVHGSNDIMIVHIQSNKTNSSFSPISNKYFGSLDVMEIDTGEYLRFLPSIAPATVPE